MGESDRVSMAARQRSKKSCLHSLTALSPHLRGKGSFKSSVTIIRSPCCLTIDLWQLKRETLDSVQSQAGLALESTLPTPTPADRPLEVPWRPHPETALSLLQLSLRASPLPRIRLSGISLSDSILRTPCGVFLGTNHTFTTKLHPLDLSLAQCAQCMQVTEDGHCCA